MIPPRPKILAAQALSCSRELSGELPSRVREISVAFEQATLTILAGPSGCGKNLLLRVLGLLEDPDEGMVLLHGAPTGRLMEQERACIRNQYFGFLFGEPYLLPSFTTLENVAMPFFKISAMNTEAARKRTEAMLEFVGMSGQAHVCAGRLSMDQQQRVALARSLVNSPQIVMVENIDRHLHEPELAPFFSLVQRAVVDFNITAIVTASSAELAGVSDRVLELAGGQIHFDSAAAFAKGGSVN